MATWSNGLCGCCSIKDCGPMCCINEYFCGACVWGDAMQKAGIGSCMLCCVGLICCPHCVICKAGQDVAAKYSIEEGCCGACMKACCCPACYSLQIQHEIMVKESLHYACMAYEKDGGAPVVEEMSR